MAIQRDNPYGTFNFLVDIGTGETESILAGFQEVSGMNIEVTSADYRNGNDKVNHVRKINGMYKVGDATLKRGLMGSLDLYNWINDVRLGSQTAKRSVTIQLRDEAGTATIMTWKLTNARPMRYTVPAFNAKMGTEVAVEEIVLSYEDLQIE